MQVGFRRRKISPLHGQIPQVAQDGGNTSGRRHSLISQIQGLGEIRFRPGQIPHLAVDNAEVVDQALDRGRLWVETSQALKGRFEKLSSDRKFSPLASHDTELIADQCRLATLPA